MRLLLFTIAILFSGLVQAQVLPSFGNSRTGTTGMQFLKIAPDAHSMGMAGSFIAVTNDVSSMYWNPAGMSRLDSQINTTVQVSHTAYFSGIAMENVGFIRRTSEQAFFGLNVISLNTGDMKETDEFHPFGTGRTFSPNNYLVSASYARILTSNFTFGLTGKFAHEGMAGVAVNNVMFDLGLDYLIENIKNVRFAVTITNFGINVQPSGTVTILKTSGEQNVTDFQSISVPTTFRLGASFEPIQQANRGLKLSAQLNHPSDNNETFALGAEFTMRRMLHIRTGYEFGQDETGFPPIGAGLDLRRKFGTLSFNYSFNNKVNLGNIHRISLGLSLR